jgi:serine/threonine protein kinase
VAKIFNDEKLAYYEPRLKEMIANPPKDQTRNLTPPHISIAWPERMLREGGKFVGYIMPRIQWAPDIFKVYSPKIRKTELPNFDWRHLHHTALNLSIAVHAYHSAGYVVGDLNSKNVLVNKDAMVTMIDADSIQVRTATGQVMRCPVGTPDFTPPELQSIKLDSVDRTEYHDAFALATMIFLLLMEGQHPFAGAPKNPSTSVAGPIYQYCIKNGIFPYKSNRMFKPPASALEFSSLNPNIQKLFVRCFVDGFKNPLKRPLPIEWIKTLQAAENSMTQCSVDHDHWYSSHLSSCPWCKRSKSIASRSQKQTRITAARSTTVGTAAPSKPASPAPRITQKPFMGRSQGKAAKPIKKYWWVILLLVFLGLGVGLLNGGGLAAVARSLEPLGITSIAEAGTAGDTQDSVLLQNAPEIDLDALPPISTQCPGAPALVLEVGDQATVMTNVSLRGRSEPKFSDTNVISRYKYGEALRIAYGPVCVKSPEGTAYWFWYVLDANANYAWVAEGDTSIYFLKPVD